MFLKKFGYLNKNIFSKNYFKVEFLFTQNFNFATKMRAGVTKNKKDSAGKRLGIKKFGGEEVRQGQILVRQRGFEWKEGENMYHGSDHTFHSNKEGKVSFSRDPWSTRKRTHVHVIEQEIPNRKIFPPKPFMYHPELYPELALRNKVFPKLLIPSEKYLQKNQENSQKNENSNEIENEIKFVVTENVSPDTFDENNKISKYGIFPNLYKQIKRASKYKSKFIEENASNYFEINSIRKEISHTGEIYFGVNNYKHRADIIDNFMNIFEADKNGYKFEHNSYTKTIQDERRDLFMNYTPSYFTDRNRASYTNAEAPLLEDLLEDLKNDNRLSSVHDLSGIPTTENAYGKVVRNQKDNLKKIKEYYDKYEKKNTQKIIKDFKEKSVGENNKTQNNKNKKIKN